ncbi:NAD-dependent epimerase/dehydratase family protein [Saccharomonospora piscinae]|uniref:NAD-dependent epimerase/dehydratase family protein n=1 Tax=Saccharomonospora piscinae TaxID=687388 RepID=UPI0004B76C49|nr:NAD-dependent epimerase/dehydratase family protein [Saccharomonospora piscinae]
MTVGGTVVVTGASGNVGTALLRSLARDSGTSLVGVARRVPEPGTEPYRHADWVPCDLGAPEAPDTLDAAFDGATAVVHLAWAIHPRRDDPPLWRTNTVGTRTVLRAAARAGVGQLVVGSSVAAYSPAPRWSRVSEGWATGGIAGSAYSRGKAWLERELDHFAVRHPGIALSRVRPCAVLQHDAAGEFARWLLGVALPGRWTGRAWLPLPLWPRLRVQVVHADDVAAAIHTILDRRATGAFNVAAEPVLRAADLAAAAGSPRVVVPRTVLRAGSGLAWCTGLHPLHPGWLELADRASLADTTRARTALDWVPAHDAAETVSGLAAGLRDRAGTASDALAPETAAPLWRRWCSVPWGRPSHQSQD